MLLNTLKNIVENRTVAVMSHGKSIEQLEQTIEQYKDYDICWASFNLYTIMEDYILNKINKELNIVLDGSPSFSSSYETEIRIPRFERAIKQGKLIISNWQLFSTHYRRMGLYDFYEKNKANILLVDDLFGRLDGTPNSLFLLICALAIGEPERIILFGVDGYEKKDGDEFSTYYKPELQKIRRELLLGDKMSYTLHSTTQAFEERFSFLYPAFCKRCNVKPAEIINCSPNSKYTLFPKISYEELPKWIN